MKSLLPLFLLLSCAVTPNWNLSQSILISITDPTLDQTMVNTATTMAIKNAKGIISTDPNTKQKLTLYTTDKDTCLTDSKAVAFADLNNGGKAIGLCKRQNITPIYTETQLEDILKHEFGHLLANRRDHLDCASKSIMTAQGSCHQGVMTYTSLDVEYICSTKNTIGGIC